jgi:flagellar motility protein MotE (MotC chaperone)
MMACSRARKALCLARAAPLLLALLTCTATAAEKPAGSVPNPPAAAPPPVAPAGAQPSDAAQYCGNIANAAADARFAWQAKTLADLNKQLEQQIAALESKRAELEEWVKRRDELLAQAEDSVVAIYAKMRPEAAALQLASVDAETAAAVLAKLNSRTASAILNEMDPARAASLTSIMTAGGSPAEGKPS